MRQLKTFITTLKRSLFETSYYPDILKADFWFSWKYLFFLMICLTAIQVAIMAFQAQQYFPQIVIWTKEFKVAAQSFYPKELEVTVKNGLLATNVQEPYYILLPKIRGFEQFEGTRVIAIDTKGSIDDFIKYRSAVLVTDRAIVYPERQRNGATSYQVSYLNNIPKNITINKKIYDVALAKIEPYWNKIPDFMLIGLLILLIVAPFVGGLIVTSGKLLYLLIMTLLIMLIVKIMKKELNYGQIYRLGMHGISLPILITFLTGFFNVQIPLLYSIVFVVWMILILRNFPSKIASKSA